VTESPLPRLADLLRQRNALDAEISALIRRPSMPGHVGEFIAAAIFDIALNESATQKGSDGVFRSGALAGKSVNVKLYGFQEGILDVKVKDPPDVYLVLTGPKRAAASSRGVHRPMTIHVVYVFLHDDLVRAGVRPGVAASVRKAFWEAAEVWPSRGSGAPFVVAPEPGALLDLFR
jgi:hypothetical protein